MKAIIFIIIFLYYKTVASWFSCCYFILFYLPTIILAPACCQVIGSYFLYRGLTYLFLEWTWQLFLEIWIDHLENSIIPPAVSVVRCLNANLNCWISMIRIASLSRYDPGSNPCHFSKHEGESYAFEKFYGIKVVWYLQQSQPFDVLTSISIVRIND